MLIIAGKVYVAPEARDTYVESHRELVRQARAAPGCVDLAISADPVDPRRVNMLEQWQSEEHLAAFRAVARSIRSVRPARRSAIKRAARSSRKQAAPP